jgi:hypothetical protein
MIRVKGKPLDMWLSFTTGTMNSYQQEQIQGTFREHSGNIQGTIREHSGNIQGTFSLNITRISLTVDLGCV